MELPKRLTAVITLLAALGLAGCGGGAIDNAKVERQLRGRIPPGSTAPVVAAQCPSGVDALAGAVFDCDVRLRDGVHGLWRVQIAGNGQVAVPRTGFTTDVLRPGPSEIGRAKLIEAPGGVRLSVTPLRYTPTVAEASGDPGTHIAGILLAIANVGSAPYRDGKPGLLSELRLPTGLLASPPHRREHRPCGGRFYRSPLTLAPGARALGCIPYEVPDGTRANFFSFAPGQQPTTNWSLG